MKQEIKKLIAKEGLIFLFTIGLGILLISISLIFRPSLDEIYKGTVSSSFPYGKMIVVGKLFVISYPTYLIIKFVLWSIKTLKK